MLRKSLNVPAGRHEWLISFAESLSWPLKPTHTTRCGTSTQRAEWNIGPRSKLSIKSIKSSLNNLYQKELNLSTAGFQGKSSEWYTKTAVCLYLKNNIRGGRRVFCSCSTVSKLCKLFLWFCIFCVVCLCISTPGKTNSKSVVSVHNARDGCNLLLEISTVQIIQRWRSREFSGVTNWGKNNKKQRTARNSAARFVDLSYVFANCLSL